MNWYIRYKKENIDALKRTNRLSPLDCVLLGNRGITTAEAAEAFLNPAVEMLHDPYLFDDMEIAVNAVVDCLSAGSSIRIIGDYDQDGVSATAILVKGLRRIAEEMGYDPFLAVSYQVPDRLEDGYGINAAMVDRARSEGMALLITCDNGISAFDAVERANACGIPVIITDHHQLVVRDGVESVPNALAVLNPHRSSDHYPFRELCGAGVAYKFIQAIAVAMEIPDTEIQPLLELAALGTICDVVPLVGENRVIVAEGLRRINETDNLGIKALLHFNQWNKPVSVYTVGFVIGPCINASGRLFTASLGVELFLESDQATINAYAEELVKLNEERKAMTAAGLERAVEAIEHGMLYKQDVIMIYLADVHESICGLIAGRIKERYQHPVLVFTDAKSTDGETSILKGSGRSIEAFNMFEQLNRHRDEYISFGGHAMACGMSIDKAKFDYFNALFNAESALKPDDFVASVDIDAPLRFDRLDFNLVASIERLAPFGAGNPRPVFAAKRCNVLSLRLVGAKKNVLQLRLEKDGRQFGGVMFSGDEKLKTFTDASEKEAIELLLSGRVPGVAFDVVYRPEINSFNEQERIQLMISDFRFSR